MTTQTIRPKTERQRRTIPLIKPDLPILEEVEREFREILGNGKITNFGKYNNLFEEEAAKYLGTLTATTSSGTMGLILVMKALGLEPGKKVILPSFTFMATAQAVLYAGATPVFAEVGDDLNLCVQDLDSQLTKHHPDVTAVLPVHMYGLPARTEEIAATVAEHASRRGQPIRTIYDAAHGFGSSVQGRKVGGSGDAEVFSLSVTKAMVSVEGGMVASRDPELIRRIKKLRNYGIEENYNAHWQGLNGKMSEFHAIVGLANLRQLDARMARRQERARAFSRQIRERTSLDLVPWPEGVVNTFKDFTILLPRDLAPRRTAIVAGLQERGVETRAYFYPPVHEQNYFRRFADRPLPRTEELSRRVLTLPFFTTITDDEIDYIVTALAEVC